MESVEYQNLKFTVWDVGGQDKIRQLWRHYYNNTHALIYVVDSADKQSKIIIMAYSLLMLMQSSKKQGITYNLYFSLIIDNFL